MTKKRNETENLPVVKTESFALTSPVDPSMTLPTEISESFNDEDFDGIKAETSALPIVRIRQKPLTDDGGATLIEAGSFKIYDPVTNENEKITIPDVAGKTGLLVTPIRDIDSRVHFPEGADKPSCKSMDGISGQGEQADQVQKEFGTPRCEHCPLSKLVNGSRSKCTAQKNVLVREAGTGNPYVLNLGPSALRHYRNFVAGLKRPVNGQVIPAIATFMRITTKYVKDPQPHFVPVFAIESLVQDMALLQDLRAFKRESGQRLESTIEVMPDDDGEQKDAGPGTIDEQINKMDEGEGIITDDDGNVITPF